MGNTSKSLCWSHHPSEIVLYPVKMISIPMKVCTVYLVSLQIERQEATCFCIGLESVSDVYMYSVSIIVICSTCNVHSFCILLGK